MENIFVLWHPEQEMAPEGSACLLCAYLRVCFLPAPASRQQRLSCSGGELLHLRRLLASPLIPGICLCASGPLRQSHALQVGESRRTSSWGCPISCCGVPLWAMCCLLFPHPASFWEAEEQLWGGTQRDAFSDACSVSSLGLVMIGVICGARKAGINPDNVATPIAASLGDIVTLSLLAAFSSVFFKYIGTVFSSGVDPCETAAGNFWGVSGWRLPLG